ncbi:MAG: MATE family efflux transporter, partial [Erysipelotrichaceae bacterium]|nr:MATE family efflux transporter [Erysipelotrichaceae bacterium]
MTIDNETKEFIKEVFVLALPVGVQQIINLLVNMIDNIMVGQLGELAITAVSISGTYTWLVMVAGMGMARGANVIMSQYWGAG